MRYYFLFLLLILFQLPSYAIIEDDGVLLTPDTYAKETNIDEISDDPSQYIYDSERQMNIDKNYGSSNSRGYLNSPKKSFGGGDAFDRNY